MQTTIEITKEAASLDSAMVDAVDKAKTVVMEKQAGEIWLLRLDEVVVQKGFGNTITFKYRFKLAYD